MERNRALVIAAAFVLLSGLLIPSGQAQQTQTRSFEIKNAQGVFNFPELGAVIIQSDSILTVGPALPGARRPAEYREVDLKTGDTLLMVNGKRIRTAAELEAVYENLAIGETLKLGLRRGKDLLLASFAKADPADLPQMTFQMKTDKDGSEATDLPEGKQMMMVDASDTSLLPLLELGLMLREGEHGLTVDRVLQNAAEVFGSAAPTSGAIVTAINGTAVSTVADFRQVYDKLAEGDKLTFDYKADGDERSVAVMVPEKARIQMRKEARE
jgi:S1-C subfamily serine protease